MTLSLEEQTLSGMRKLFAYYRQLGTTTLERLTQEQLLWQPDDYSNSVAMIVQHLSGNMKSRFTDWLTTDGEKEWRNRDAEFEPVLAAKEAVQEAWESGWKVLFTALEALQPQQLSETVYIRNEGHTVLEALQRQLAHYPYHIGQMIVLAKQLQGNQWASLSIPKSGSRQYNERLFAQEKGSRHFTEGMK